ncbi:hypothetical protein [Inhella proteolytica]|nr:hypothetical protein [Inhella proteolytica]
MLLALLALLALCSTMPARADDAEAPKRRPNPPWIDRPLGYRYIVFFHDGMGAEVAREVANEWHEDGRDHRSGGFSWPRYFEPRHRIRTDGNPRYDLVIHLIEFDEEGWVRTPHSYSKPLRLRFNHLLTVALSSGDDPYDPFDRLGKWFHGFEDSDNWAPTLCGFSERPDGLNSNDRDYLYGPMYRHDDQRPSFGCREWAHQLKSASRPYIDVTSYRPKAPPSDTYIKEFVGWARFGDNKPVIGLHMGHWYCLLDCPGGDAPGRIANIKLWAARNGWPAPKPPKRMPMFPDPLQRRGAED